MIEISDNSNGILTVTLPKLLSEFGYDSAKLNWSILYLSATGDLGENTSIVDFEESISDSPNGFLLEWQQLKDLADKFDQMFDAIIVGSVSKNLIRKYDDDKDLFLNYDVVLDLFDGSYWRVYSKNVSVINKLADKFTDVKHISFSSLIED